MPVFRCVYIDEHGKRVARSRGGIDEQSLRSSLTSSGYRVVSIKRSGTPRNGKRRRHREVIELTRSLAIMVGSGVSVADSLRAIGEDAGAQGQSSLAAQLVARLNRGDSFADIVSRMPETFTDTYSGLVAVGEQAGTLDTVLPVLVEYLERDDDTRSRIVGSLIYPVVVLVTAVIGMGVIVLYAIPRLSATLSALDPAAAAAVLRQATAMRVLAGVVLGSAIAVVVFGIVLRRARANGGPLAELFDRIVLSVPIMGDFLRSTNTLNFSFSMTVLLSAGVTVSQALLLAERSINNQQFRTAIAGVRERVDKGDSLAAALRSASEVLPPLTWRWTRIAERTGDLSDAFRRLRDYYAGRVDRTTSRFVTLLEPGIILIVGVFLILLVVFFLRPLFSSLGTMI
jgi:general secretion pathway protein F